MNHDLHHSVNRRAQGNGLAHEADFVVGRMRVRPSLGEVELAGERRHLEPRVMQVLIALVRADGAVLSRDDLISRCWDGVIVGDDAINRVISKVRHLADGKQAGFHVETLPRVGYRLTNGPGRDPRRARTGEWRIGDGGPLVVWLIALSLLLAIALLLVILLQLRP